MRSACSAAAFSPLDDSLRASRSAPDFVRTNTRTGPSFRRRNFASHSVFCDCRDLLDGMRDPPRRAARGADLHEAGIPHDFVRQLHDFLGHRRREEQRLPRGAVRQRRDDPADVGPEAHVHHPVRLVEHERVELVERDGAVAHVIHQPAGRGDDDVDARLERALLRIHRDAAVDRDAGEVRVIGEALDVVFDLDRQLAGRREDQDAGEAALLRRRLARAQHPVQDRQQEGGRLAGAGVGAANQVVAVHHDGDDGALDRRRRSRSRGSRMPSMQRGLEAQRVERDRAGVVLRLDPR